MKKQVLLAAFALVCAAACQPKASENMEQAREPEMMKRSETREQPADQCDTQKGRGGCCGAENERPAQEKAESLPQVAAPAPTKAEPVAPAKQTASAVSEEKPNS